MAYNGEKTRKKDTYTYYLHTICLDHVLTFHHSKHSFTG